MGSLGATDREITIYSYYRDAELRGANLLFRLLRLVDDAESQVNLTRHLADEARHAWLWTQRIQELGGAPIPVSDGYQVRIGKRAGVPRNVVDLFGLTVVVEQRALKRYTEHLRRPDTCEPTRRVLEAVTQDEGWHIDWIRRKGRELAERAGEPERLERALARFRDIDRAVMAELDAFERGLAEG